MSGLQLTITTSTLIMRQAMKTKLMIVLVLGLLLNAPASGQVIYTDDFEAAHRSSAGSPDAGARLPSQVFLTIQSWTLRRAQARAPPIPVATVS